MTWSLVLIEFDMVVVAMIWILVFRRNKPTFTWIQPAEEWFRRLAENQTLSIVFVGLLTLAIRVALLPVLGIPKPSIHDEFSYLLAADTFAHGRLTNPMHPMWIHFETFHVIQQPTYMSMYPPAQGLVLALGQILGHPWIGVLLSTAAMCAAICWALQGWLPSRWALLGALLATYRIGVFSYWMNSYWGGSVPAFGGALVFGALPRLLRKPSAGNSMVMGAGLIILANSRPYEGLVFSAPIIIVLLASVVSGKHAPVKTSLYRTVLPLAFVLAVGAVATGYYYHRVTGSAFRMTYQVERDTYAMARYFVWQHPRPEPSYHHAIMKKFYQWELQACQENQTLIGFFKRNLEKFISSYWAFYLGPVLTIPFLAIRRFLNDPQMRIVRLTVLTFLIGLSIETWVFSHYIAPATALLFLIVVHCMRSLKLKWHFIGPALMRSVVVICCATFAVAVVATAVHALRGGTAPNFSSERATVLLALQSLPRTQLVIVRYGIHHDFTDEWVYNRADVDGSKVVWARDMGPSQNAELIRYFRQRQVWSLDADPLPPRLTPYVDSASGANTR